jgi:hypothetical protein
VTDPPHPDLVRLEAARRDATWDPVERWQAIQRMIAWAEQQVGRNTPRGCLEAQRKALARLASGTGSDGGGSCPDADDASGTTGQEC